jgi:hypothetical protein
LGFRGMLSLARLLLKHMSIGFNNEVRYSRWNLRRVLALVMDIPWCPEGDLNPHNPCGSADFKSAASANFAIRANWNVSHTNLRTTVTNP